MPYNRNRVSLYLGRERQFLLGIKQLLETEYIRLQVEDLHIKCLLRKAAEQERAKRMHFQNKNHLAGIKASTVTATSNAKRENVVTFIKVEPNSDANEENSNRREELEKEWTCNMEDDWSRCLEPLNLDPRLHYDAASESEDDTTAI